MVPADVCAIQAVESLLGMIDAEETGRRTVVPAKSCGFRGRSEFIRRFCKNIRSHSWCFKQQLRPAPVPVVHLALASVVFGMDRGAGR